MIATLTAAPTIHLTSSRSLNSFRVVACLIVVLSHIYELVYNDYSNPVNETLSYYAVAVFFFISGWVNTVSLSRVSAVEFYRKRFWRIYPTYAVALTLALGLSMMFGVFRVSDLGNFLFLNPVVGTVTANLPLWSLSYEVALYLAFPLILARSQVLRFLGASALLVFFAWFGHLPLLLAFALGVLAAVMRLRLPRFEFFSDFGRYTYEVYVFHYVILFVISEVF